MSRKDDVPAGARQMPDFDKLAEICRKPIEDTRPLEPSDLIVKQAFSVKWIWGWLEMHGYKTTEYRSSPPRYRLRGRCAGGSAGTARLPSGRDSDTPRSSGSKPLGVGGSDPWGAEVLTPRG